MIDDFLRSADEEFALTTFGEIKNMTDLGTTLKERNKTHGDFKVEAEIVQTLKLVISRFENWDVLSFEQKQAIEMILLKLARVVNGDKNHIDNWHDIAGYATLVENSIRLKQIDIPDSLNPNI